MGRGDAERGRGGFSGKNNRLTRRKGDTATRGESAAPKDGLMYRGNEVSK